MLRSETRQRYAGSAIAYIFLILYAVFTLIPILWILTTSLKPRELVQAFPPQLIPSSISLESYRYVLADEGLMQGLQNTFLVSVPAVILSVVISALAGYAFARYEFPGKRLLLLVLMGLFMMPVIMNVVPLYILFQRTGLLNTRLGLILADQILIVPLNVFLLKTYFETIPRELEEAAQVDGCTQLGALRRVIVPLSGPGLAAAAIFAFRFAWNEFVFALTFIGQPDRSVFQVALYRFLGIERTDWGVLSAGIIIAMLPIVLLFVIFQRQMITGLTIGSVKG